MPLCAQRAALYTQRRLPLRGSTQPAAAMGHPVRADFYRQFFFGVLECLVNLIRGLELKRFTFARLQKSAKKSAMLRRKRAGQ